MIEIWGGVTMTDRDSARRGAVHQTLSGLTSSTATRGQRIRSVAIGSAVVGAAVAAGVLGGGAVVAEAARVASPDLTVAGIAGGGTMLAAAGAGIFATEYPGAGWGVPAKRSARRTLFRTIKNLSIVPALGVGAVAVAEALVPGAGHTAMVLGEVASGCAATSLASATAQRSFSRGLPPAHPQGLE
jgi:hypothetical protein